MARVPIQFGARGAPHRRPRAAQGMTTSARLRRAELVLEFGKNDLNVVAFIDGREADARLQS